MLQDIKDLLNPSKTNLKIHENAQVRQFQSKTDWNKKHRKFSIMGETNAKKIGWCTTRIKVAQNSFEH